MTRKAGGGYGSNVNKNVGVRTGAPRHVVNPRGVSQIGSSLGNHATEHRQSLKGAAESVITSKVGISQPLGNALAAATECKPGGSREVQRSGGQGTYGPVNPGQPNPGNAGKDILREYGRDSANVRGRR